ncbi:hypothetical protein [Ekhidna sp.]|uniref:hypothetical protein n=1 Tax=Ekhidna sp. TaxID=2608089 RepID=UPI003B59B533
MKITKSILGILVLFLGYSCVEEEISPSQIEAPIAGVPVFDQSGDIEIKVFMSTTTSYRSSHDSHSVNVGSGYVLIGGGAYTIGVSEGAYITESRPSTNKRTWYASSKDHGGRPDPHKLTVYAIGIKLRGLTRDQTASYVKINVGNYSSFQAHPDSYVDMPTGYHLIGGGAEVDWSGSGNLLTASYPDGNRWRVASKDHLVSSPARIRAFAIGIKKQIAGFGNILKHVNSPSGSYVSWGLDDERSYAPIGYVVTCPGAEVDYGGGSGRMLMGLRPDSNLDYTESISKDHVNKNAGRLYNYVLSIRKQ